MSKLNTTERLLRRDRAVLVALFAALFLLSALYTVFGVGMNMTALEMTAMSSMRDMPGDAVPGQWSFAYALLTFLMWWVMMVAMMLPSVSPTVLLYSALVRHSSNAAFAHGIATWFLFGYLTVWAGFSFFATALQWWLESIGLVSQTMMTLIDTTPGALVLIAAGIFQFTPLKEACLSHCQSPAEFLTQRKRPGVSGAFVMGVEHGAYCLGCCWFLMALLFVGGIMNLYWIVGLAAFVAIEKLTPYGAAFSKVAGSALVMWGVFVLVSVF